MEGEQQFTYRDYLQREFQIRTRKNPAYSLRAFARDLGMQPSKLSEILRKTCGLGEGMAVEVSKKLRLSEVETQHFVTLVEAEHARSQFKREQARSLLKRFSQVYGYSELDLERFKIISDWYHLAFLELIEVEDFQCDFDWVARRLGISRPLVENAFQRLIEFGLMKIEADGRWVRTEAFLATPSGIPSREIREHHQQMLEKAMATIDGLAVSERELSSYTLSLHEDQVLVAKKMIAEFNKTLGKTLQEQSPKQRVFGLTIQFFPLDRKNSEIN